MKRTKSASLMRCSCMEEIAICDANAAGKARVLDHSMSVVSSILNRVRQTVNSLRRKCDTIHTATTRVLDEVSYRDFNMNTFIHDEAVIPRVPF